MTRKLIAATAALLASLAFAPLARAAAVPEDADWSEATIYEKDGTKLHADILRPKGAKDTDKTPVILSIGPYFNHSGQVGAAGPVEDASYDPVGPSSGPSDRFYDFVEGSGLLKQGYTFVMVDLRGFGGSSGCLDWGGPGEQRDVVEAVDWAANRAWSTGKVGMYGKSYDGVTGLIGAMRKPAGLKAVVSQEPVYDLYRYLYTNGVRYSNSLLTPALYDLIAETPGPALDNPFYNLNGAMQNGDCPVQNYAAQQDPNHRSFYWQQRDFIGRSKGTTVPVFLTQGFLENNTKPDGAFEYYNGLAGPKRAWFGMWDHVRGNDTDAAGRLAMGRQGWFDEVMRWYDHFLKGADSGYQKDPPVAVETSDGSWRSEQAWPPADATTYTSPLNAGEYSDDTQNNGSGEGGSPNGQGVWTFSKPLADDAHLAGVPRATLDVDGPSDANVTIDVYDVSAAGSALLLSRSTTLLGEPGTKQLELYGNDWKLPAGHRLGVLVTSSNSEWWLHRPSFGTVTVKGGSISLPFLAKPRPRTIEGGPSIRLDAWKQDAPFDVDAATIAAGESPAFVLPGKQPAGGTVPPAAGTDSGAGTGTATGNPAGTVTGGQGDSHSAGAARPAAAASARGQARASARRYRARLSRRGGRYVVTGKAPSGSALVVRLRRGDFTIATKRVTARRGVFRATFAMRRYSRVSALVTAAPARRA